MSALGSVVAATLLCVVGITVCKAAFHKAAATGPNDRSSRQNDKQVKLSLEFLQRHMPGRDEGIVSNQLLLEHVHLALKARQANQWASDVPWDLFLNDVLPYRNLDESIDDFNWRVMFHERFSPMVAGADSLTAAAQILNRDIWQIWGLHFVSDQTPEIMSPGQVIAAGYASCTGLAIFLANACRAVGIPARVAGTPSWVTDRRDAGDRFNNHNWVEVWDGKSWSFTGAAEYTPAGFNRTWFFPHPAKRQLPGHHWHAIYAASYKHTGTVFPLAWSPEDNTVPGVDVTQTYIDADAPTSMEITGHSEAATAAATPEVQQRVTIT